MGHVQSQPQVAIEPIPPALAKNADYEVIREINRGGMGVVYLVRNRRMDRLEALKVVNPALLKHPGALERFEREMRAAARLNHPNIVTAYSSPPLEGLLAFAMEYIDGIDLFRLVKLHGPLAPSNACYYIYQAALGLQHGHERQMVHRDIKPNNLMLTRDGKKQVIKILDFGLAKASSENPLDEGLTGEGQILGTPLYMAPEQIKSTARADVRADIYSLGCTLYYLLTGHPPFKDKGSVYEIFQAHLTETPRALGELRADVPSGLPEALSRMMARDAAARYQQPSDVAQALAPYFKQGIKSIAVLRTGAAPAAAADAAVSDTAAGEETKARSAEQQARAKPVSAETGNPRPAAADDPRAVSKASFDGAWLSAIRGSRRFKVGIGATAAALTLAACAVWTFDLFRAKEESHKTDVLAGPEERHAVASAAVPQSDSRAANVESPASESQQIESAGIPEADPISSAGAPDDLAAQPGIPSNELLEQTGNASVPQGQQPDEPSSPADPSSPHEPRPADPLKSARNKHAADVKKAEKALLSEFEKELGLLARNRMKPDDRLRLIEAVRAEKAAFERSGLIPWSAPMRPALLVYLRELMLADAAIKKAYDRSIPAALKSKDHAAAEVLRSELREASHRRLLATWACTGSTFQGSWAWKFYSDGTLELGNRAPSSLDQWNWAIEGNVLVVKTRNANDPNVQNVARCTIAADGASFTAENQKKDRFVGRLERPAN